MQIVSTTAPSLRIDNLQTGATKRAGLGLATAVNNFIQGSVDLDFCIFNGSTAAASPILFGVYDAGAGNVQEAARISPARNLLVGTTTDGGQKLQINGTSRLSGFTFVNHSTANSYGAAIYNTNVNGEGLAIRGGSTASHSSLLVQTYDGNIELFKVLANGFVSVGSATPTEKLQISGTGNNYVSVVSTNSADAGIKMNSVGNREFGILSDGNLRFYDFTSSADRMRIVGSTGNILIGTLTDNGNKLQVNGGQTLNGGLRYFDFIGATTNFWECYHYNDNTFRMNYNGSGGDEFVYSIMEI